MKKNMKNSLKKFHADKNSAKTEFDEKGKNIFRRNVSGEIEKKLKADNCDFFQEECDSEISDDSSDEVSTYARACARRYIFIFSLFLFLVLLFLLLLKVHLIYIFLQIQILFNYFVS
jgi:hypothetical protein